MPIKIKVNNNSSSIRTHVTNESKEVVTKKDNLSAIHTDIKSSNNVPVHTINDSDEVKMRNGCDVTGKKLELEIKDEARARAAADEKLEKQIQDIVVEGVSVDDTTITFNKEHELAINPEVLEDIDNKQDEIEIIELSDTSGILPESTLKLLGEDANKLSYNNIIYALSSKNDKVKTYFAENNQNTLNQIDVNIFNGHYEITSRLNIDGATLLLDKDNKISLNQTLNGGYLVVDTLHERDNISKKLLKVGTLCKVNKTKIVYEWSGVSWDETIVNITGIGLGLKLSPTGVLSVDTTDVAEYKNPQPITSHGVYVIVGDVVERLESI